MEKPTEIHALKCADCARSDSAATDLRPTGTLPITAEALAGFPDGVSHERRYSRRRLLQSGLLGVASVYAASRLDLGTMLEAAAAEAAEPMQRSLVCIYLNGGNDGLNTVLPVTGADYAAYQSARGAIARGLGPSTGGQVGTTVLPGTGGTLGWANVGVPLPGLVVSRLVLRIGAWPQVDLKRTVLLETQPAAVPTPRRPGTVRILDYTNTEVVLEAESPDGGWAVLNDLWHPYWFADIDGRPVAIERANVLFRAVALPPGRHRITFRFKPLSGALDLLKKPRP